MQPRERTTDIYEQIPGCPKPPLIAFPDPENWHAFETADLGVSVVSRWLAKAATATLGIRPFLCALPSQAEHLLRTLNLRRSYLFSPVVSATLALEDDGRNPSPFERAATLVMAARNLYLDIVSGNFAVDQLHGHVLEMGQYPNLFSTCLIIEDGYPRIFKSSKRSQITVMASRRPFLAEIGDPGSQTSLGDLVAMLKETAVRARRRAPGSAEPNPGLLTYADHETQRQLFSQLGEDRINRSSLSALRHSFLTLCLDLEQSPSSAADAAFLAHSGDCANRWGHSSCQIVVFANAKACVICNFSAYLSGNTMMRAAAELQRRAASCPLAEGSTERNVRLPPAVELEWKMGAALMERANRDLEAVLDHQQATFEIVGIGRNEFARCNVAPVPAFTLAVQLSALQLTGRMARITQFVSASAYRCMDVVTADITTPEMMQCVELLARGNLERDAARDLVHQAVSSQQRVCRRARQRLPEADILALFLLTAGPVRQRSAMATLALTSRILRFLGALEPRPLEIVVSHPRVFPEVPVVGRPGARLPYLRYFGIHYQIVEAKTVVTVMPSTGWTISNAELMCSIERHLRQILEVTSQATGVASAHGSGRRRSAWTRP
jgi:hypothetical protein